MSSSNNRGGGGGGRGGGVDPSPLLHSSDANNTDTDSTPSSTLFDTSHLQTYTAGEDAGRLADAARALGLSSHRRPRKQVRASQSHDGKHHHHHRDHHHKRNTDSSRGIEGFVSDFITNVGVLFNDRTLEYARMHAVDSHLIVEGRVPLEPPGVTDATATGLPVLGFGEGDEFEREKGRRKEEEQGEEREEMIDPHLSAAGAGGTIAAAVFGIIKAMVGPAILYLPHGFATSGYIVAVPIMLVCTGMYLYASRCLLECWRYETFGELLCQINVTHEEESSSSSSSSSSESGGNDERGEIGNDNQDDEDGILMNEEMVRLVSFPEEEEDEGGIQEEAGIRSRNGSLSPPNERKYGTIAPDNDGDDDDRNVIFSNVDEENGTQLVGMVKGRSGITKNKHDSQPSRGPDPPPPASRRDHLARTTTKHPKMLSYPELAYRALGSSGETFVMTGIALMQFGVCLTYLIFVPQNLRASLITLFDLRVPLPLLLSGMVCLEIPLSWIRDIRKLTPTNILANGLILFGLITCLAFAIGGAEERNETAWEELRGLDPVKSTWYLFIGTSVLLFEGSITLLVPLQEAVQGHYNRAVFPNVYSRVILSIIGFYLFFGITCWMSFGDTVKTVLTTSLPSGYLATSVQFAYSIAVIFTFPLQNFPALEIVCRYAATSYQSMSGKKDSLLVNRNFVSSILVFLLAMVAFFTMDSLGNVVSLMGSLLGCPIAFVFPPLIHSQLIKGLPKSTKMMDYVVAALGLVSTIAASILTVVTWGESKG